MHPCTISYAGLRIEWTQTGTLTLARDDRAEAIQLSKSEVLFLIRALDLMRFPVAPDLPPGLMPT